MRAASFAPMGTVYEDGKQIAALERQHQHLQDHEHERHRRASLSAHARLEEEIRRRQAKAAN